MKKLQLIIFVCVAMVFQVQPVAAQSNCGLRYVVGEGDTLASIAAALYPDKLGYQILFSANSNVIGTDLNNIPNNVQLIVPCLDGSTLVRQVGNKAFMGDETENPPADLTTAALTEPAIDQPREDDNLPARFRPVLFVAGDYDPYTGAELFNGGMFTEIVERAIRKSRRSSEFRIDYIDDRSAHLQTLIKHNLYDFSIGWTLPPCVDPSLLTDNLSKDCDAYSYSVPIFEEAVQFYFRPGLSGVSSHSELVNLSQCEAEGWPTESVLVGVGVAYEDVVSSAPLRTQENCILAVANGEYDFAVISINTANAMIKKHGLSNSLNVTNNLLTTRLLSLIINSNHPERRELISEVNTGLFKVRLSGEWYQIVQKHLSNQVGQ